MSKQEHIPPEVTEDAGVSFSPAELERQIDKITSSRPFREAKALRKLLDYLARRTFEAPEVPPKENEIAVEVLDRASDYDSRVDSSARVLAARLRSKLAEYYVSEGRADAIHVELPRGAYTLRFHSRAEPLATAAVDVAAGARARVPRRRLAWIAAALVLVSAGAGFFAASRLGAYRTANSEGTRWGPEMQAFWRPFTDGSKPVLIVLGTPLFARISKFLLRRADLNTWDNLSGDQDIKKIERLFGSRAQPVFNYAAAGESLAGMLIARMLAPHKADILFRRSSNFQWEDLGAVSAIFLGAPKVNLPTRYLPLELPFVCEPEGISNLRPMPGEPRLFRDGEGEFYAAVIRISAVQGLGEILVVASMQTEGTWGAVEYLVEPAHLKELLGRLRRADGSIPPRYQALLRVKMVEQVPIIVGYVTHRELP